MFLKDIKNIKEKRKILYSNCIKIHHYCKKAIAGKKLISKRSVLHLGSNIRWLHPRLRPWTALWRGWGGLENKREEGSHAFSMVLLHKQQDL